MRSLAILVLALALGACAGSGGGLNSVGKTNRLLPGMSPTEVKTVLGDPSQSQFSGNKLVWKYGLHENWKGFVPYYLVFGGEPPALERWYADEAEYLQQQLLWLKALTPAPGATGSTGSTGNASKDACTRKYTVYEDRMCYCYNVCR